MVYAIATVQLNSVRKCKLSSISEEAPLVADIYDNELRLAGIVFLEQDQLFRCQLKPLAGAIDMLWS